MKLSIQILFEKIAFPDTSLVTDQKMRINLAGVRFFRPNIELHEEFVYIITNKQLVGLQSNCALTFICLGTIEQALIPSRWSVIIMPSQSDVISLLEQVQAIFDDYHAWVAHLNDAIYNDEPLQSILDTACSYLKNPVALFDDSQGLLMHTSHMNPDKIDAIWQHVLDNGYSLREVDSVTLNEKFASQHHPFYYQSPDSFGSIKRLIAPITVNSKLFGSLAMTELLSPFTDSEYSNLCLTQQIIENALKVNDEFRKNHETPWYLYRLINNTYVDANILSHHLALAGRKITDPYFLWCFSASTQTHNFNMNSYIKQLSKQFKDSLIFSYHSTILVCDYDITTHKKQLADKIHDFLSKNEFQATTSMIFNNLTELNLAYLQCQISKEFVDDSTFEVICFKDIYSDYILATLDKNTNLDILISPQLRALNLNEPYTRELLSCLRAYIANGKNISATATALNIHRHTVVYRLKNIENHTGLQYEKSEDQDLFQLFLSCNILLRK